jgi:hypothetical protein
MDFKIMLKNILVNGCSFTATYGSWPFYLTNFNVTNIGCMGAGNTYIHDSTINEIARRPKVYDFVVIMWSGLTRVDIKVEDIELFANTQYTSKEMVSKQDCPERILYPTDGLDYIEKNWVLSTGHTTNNCKNLIKTKLFESIYTYQGIDQLTESSLIKMISLQSILKQHQMPYLFTYYHDYDNKLKKFNHLYEMLDQKNIYNDENIYTMTTQNKCYNADGVHPGNQIHKMWATKITEIINKNGH